MTNRSETKAYFFRSLRISFSAARWSVWTGPTCRGPHLRIDSAPEVDHAAGDFQIRLIQMPGAVWLGAALAQIGCDHGTEMIHPAPNGLVRDQNPALRQQVFHIAKAEREPKIQPYRLAYNLRREEVAGLADFLHSIRYRAARPIASPKRRDGADVARAASGSRKSRAKIVVVETTSEGATSVGKPIINLSSVTTVGLDLAKHVFQVHAVDASGRVVVAKAMRRNKLRSCSLRCRLVWWGSRPADRRITGPAS